uniref:SH3 domain-containing protein n=1 Tax=Rhizochromulina marina TaxID=1034831 RepID=A0A7S2W4J2_9STRA
MASGRWQLALAGAKHAARHRTLARFQSGDSASQNAEYDQSVQGFVRYMDQVKGLRLLITGYVDAITNAFGKAGRMVEVIVKLTEEDAGIMALQATRLRSIVARIQATIKRRLAPELETVLMSELNEQLTTYKEVTQRMSARLRIVAEANHYSDKCDRLRQVEERAPEKAQREKIIRNADKKQQALRLLEEETQVLMQTFAGFMENRKYLMTTRCTWLVRVFQTFFGEVTQVHMNTDEDAADALLDVGVEKESTRGATVASRRLSLAFQASSASVTTSARNVGSIASRASQRISMAVRHKSVFQGSADGVSELSDGSYEIAMQNYYRNYASINSLRRAMKDFLAAMQNSMVQLGKLAQGVAELAVVTDPEDTRSVSQGFVSAVSRGQTLLGNQYIDQIQTECIDMVSRELESYTEVRALASRRNQTALEASHYAGKVKSLREKAGSDEEKLQRNQSKYEQALRQLEGETEQIMQLLASFDDMRRRVITNVIGAFENHQTQTFKNLSSVFTVGGTSKEMGVNPLSPFGRQSASSAGSSLMAEAHTSPAAAGLNKPRTRQSSNDSKAGNGAANSTTSSTLAGKSSTRAPTSGGSRRGSAKSSKSRMRVRALFDFPGVQDGDLSFKEGDVFEADEKEFRTNEKDSGWVTGWHKGKHGVFPSNYVQRL